jgi:(4S)-4-hydroxy-5-phosphonooxypentane-2,3-dione isomerase
MIVLAVTWMAAPGKEAEVTEVFRMLEEASRREPGCLLYVVHQHRSDSRRFFIYEQYRDDDALEAHRQSAHFQEYAVKALSGIGTRREGELYLPITPAGSST